jgi:hypothetical protein
MLLRKDAIVIENCNVIHIEQHRRLGGPRDSGIGDDASIFSAPAWIIATSG